MVVGFISLNPDKGEYVIRFVSNLRQVGGLLWGPPPIKLTATI
jgi:hypothetical protein